MPSAAEPVYLTHWPSGVPRHLDLPSTNLFNNLETSARNFPDKPAVIFYGAAISYSEMKNGAERIAGFLQSECGVRAGDRVLLYMQNSPQWVMAYYGILRANAVVVPVNPMNLTDELRHYVRDSGARTAFAAQDIAAQILPLVNDDTTAGLRHVIVATYSDYIQPADAADIPIPDFVSVPARTFSMPAAIAWRTMLALNRHPGPMTAGANDLAVMPYTNGTTGLPKGCMHTHRSTMAAVVTGMRWFSLDQTTVFLAALPFSHVTGMTGSMNGALYIGATIVILTRWDRDAAGLCMERFKITVWPAISTMMVDFLSNPRVADYSLSSLKSIRGGGAAMPEAIGNKLHELTGLDYVEGYGMSETMAATHLNPPQRPKRQCLGIPLFDVDARVIDPDTLEELPAGHPGEIVVHAPQLMLGYWNNPEATQSAFIDMEGRRFLRTGDIAQVDQDGYFFMVDRMKRMINASGYKVWPAEVEALMYRHPSIHEVCVIATRDPRRGETVKALVVLKPEHIGHVSEQEIVDWSHANMAAYKSPRLVEFVPMLPKAGVGKILWRELQQNEFAKSDGQQARAAAGVRL